MEVDVVIGGGSGKRTVARFFCPHPASREIEIESRAEIHLLRCWRQTLLFTVHSRETREHKYGLLRS